MPLRQALTQARKQRVAGLELEVGGDLAPSQLSETGRRELKHLFRSQDLDVAALYAPLRRGLDAAENQAGRVEYLKQALTLSYELGPRLVVAPVGKVPALENDPRLPLFQGALEEIARHGDRVGGRLALEMGLESAPALRDFLKRFDTGSLVVCYNPGALLAGGFDPYESAAILRETVAHAHARDARLVSVMGRAAEVPVGHGDVDWLRLAGALEEIDYRGWLVVDGDNLGAAEVAASVAFLRRIFGE
ncbi:MAG: sugar phosphate isomerase/epimerase family protein [Gemmataceae bacterium]